jgi:hypothetical protein
MTGARLKNCEFLGIDSYLQGSNIDLSSKNGVTADLLIPSLNEPNKDFFEMYGSLRDKNSIIS